EELDKLVASILGEDWLKEDSATTALSSSHNNPIPEQSTDNTEISNPTFTSNLDIDSLVSSIIGDQAFEENSKPYTSKISDETQDIDELLKNIINEENLDLTNNQTEDASEAKINETGNKETDFSSTASNINHNEKIIPDDKPGENIDNLINEILNKETDDNSITSHQNSDNEISAKDKPGEDIGNIINEVLNKETVFTSTASSLNSDEELTNDDKADENIDNIINEVLNKDTDFTGTTYDLNLDEKITSDKSGEDIDNIINEVLNKETDFTSTSYDLNHSEEITASDKPEENIDDLINEILADKKDTAESEDKKINIEETVITEAANNTFNRQDSSNLNKAEPAASLEQPEKESSNTGIILLLLLLIIAVVAAWWFIFNKKEVTQKIEPIKKQVIKTTPTADKYNVIEKVIPEEKYTPPTIKKDVYKEEQEQEQNLKYNESDYSDSRIENNDNDITIILNSPETAIDTKDDSDIFKENESFNTEEIVPLAEDKTTENISEITPPTETLSKNEIIIEKAKKEKPVKVVAKRRVIIHKIVKGDTLWAIAKRYVNNPYRYPELAKLSKIRNPNRIYPGNKVKIIIYTK
ncbi:MAG: LysM peptidoglycan-binding domain-containing protein, partial [Gammaproteobacteria bacterium]|nr:LysM peptidoglycan-binding domain-containing protein [Gammaproteobacteria bacterium]